MVVNQLNQSVHGLAQDRINEMIEQKMRDRNRM